MGRGLPPPLSVFFASLAFWFCGGGLPPAGARTGTGFQRNPAYAQLLEVQFHTKLLALYFRRSFFLRLAARAFFSSHCIAARCAASEFCSAKLAPLSPAPLGVAPRDPCVRQFAMLTASLPSFLLRKNSHFFRQSKPPSRSLSRLLWQPCRNDRLSYSSSFFPDAARRATVSFVRLMFPATAAMKSA